MFNSEHINSLPFQNWPCETFSPRELGKMKGLYNQNRVGKSTYDDKRVNA